MKKTDSVRESLPFTLWLPESGGNVPLLAVLPGQEDSAERLSEKIAPFLAPSFQAEHPAALLVPHRFGGWEDWDAAKSLQDLLFDLEADPTVPLDGDRIFLLGGSGAWSVGSRFPARFAAVIPTAGPKDPYAARNLKFVPVWAFEEAARRIIPGSILTPERGTSSERTVMALRTAGGQLARYTAVPFDAGTTAWDAAFTGEQGEKTAAWLFSQNRRKQFTVTWLQPGLFRIDDYFTSSCYLVVGTEKALLIDTGMGEGDLPALVRSLTPLPVEVAITHPHRDHLAQAHRFQKCYMAAEDLKKLPDYAAQMLSFFGGTEPHPAETSEYTPLSAGDRIDLGGGVVIEAVELPGHTAHSLIFIDEAHRSVFTGDAIGSGYLALMICRREDWRPLIETFRAGLAALLPRLGALEDFAWYGGHFIQENGCDVREQESYRSGRSRYFCPIGPQVVRDMEVLCGLMLDGAIPETQFLDSPQKFCGYGAAGISFRILD